MKLSLTPAFRDTVGPALAIAFPLNGRCVGHVMPRWQGFNLISAGCCTRSSTTAMLTTGRLSRMLYVSCPRTRLVSLNDGRLSRDEFAPDGTETLTRTTTGMRLPPLRSLRRWVLFMGGRHPARHAVPTGGSRRVSPAHAVGSVPPALPSTVRRAP